MDEETKLIPGTSTEPIPTTEPEQSASSTLEEKLEVPFDQAYAPAITSKPEEVMVKLEEEE